MRLWMGLINHREIEPSESQTIGVRFQLIDPLAWASTPIGARTYHPAIKTQDFRTAFWAQPTASVVLRVHKPAEHAAWDLQPRASYSGSAPPHRVKRSQFPVSPGIEYSHAREQMGSKQMRSYSNFPSMPCIHHHERLVGHVTGDDDHVAQKGGGCHEAIALA